MRGSPPYSPLASPTPGATAVRAAAAASRSFRRTWLPLLCLAMVGLVTWQSYPVGNRADSADDEQILTTEAAKPTLIIIITPTYARPTRIPDLTKMAQTLMLVKHIHWLVVEDANQTSDAVERLLDRSGVPYTYIFTTTNDNLPRRGWTHRNLALDLVRSKYQDYDGEAVVYFADDDNTYDRRLFDEHVRRVQRIGFWAVGFSGGAKVEAPHVENNTITKWDVIYAPSRKFATDMAGFAVNLRLILTKNAKFTKRCGKSNPETCFLQQFGIPANQLEAFGYDTEPKDILVWHTQSKQPKGGGPSYGYVYEEKRS